MKLGIRTPFYCMKGSSRRTSLKPNKKQKSPKRLHSSLSPLPNPVLCPSLSSPSIDCHSSCTVSKSVYFTLSLWPRRKYLVETGHGLICTSNLNLKEGSLLTPTSFFRALDLRLVRIVPSSRTSKHIFPFLSRKGFPLVILSLENELIGASLAFEAVGGSGVSRGHDSRRDGEYIGARGADWKVSLVWRDKSENIQSNILQLSAAPPNSRP
jgi:hypothetical protein